MAGIEGKDPTVIPAPSIELLGEELELQREVEIQNLFEEDDEITPEDIEDLFAKNTSSFRCLAQILISRSSLLRHPLYHFPPLTDPGLDAAINYVEPAPGLDNVGCEHYKRICKEYGIVPISRVVKSLPTSVLDLKYYGLTLKQIRAIMDSLRYNEFVTEIILQDNWLSPESVHYISEMLVENNTVQYLNLKECNIKPEGICKLKDGLTNTIMLRELDLSYNSLGDEGFLILEPALKDNMSIFKLNLSHNNFGDETAKALARILIVNNYIEDLDLSWNNFYTGPGNKALFAALTENRTLKMLNLSWNGIGTKESVLPISKYLKATSTLEHLDISNNRLTGKPLRRLKNSIAKCASLISVKIGGNLITPNEALFLLKSFNTSPTLEFMDMENTFVNKDFVPLWKKLTRKGKSIQIEGILGNFKIYGPDENKLLFQRAKFLAMKAKKKKAKKDFGHFILQMPQESVPKQQFQDLIKKFKMKKVQKDKDLVAEIMNKFPAKKQKINLVDMRDSYMSYYPETALPPPKKKKGKKGKGKKKKKEAVAAIQPEVPTEAQPPIDIIDAQKLASILKIESVGDDSAKTERHLTIVEQPTTEIILPDLEGSLNEQISTDEQPPPSEDETNQLHAAETELQELEEPKDDQQVADEAAVTAQDSPNEEKMLEANEAVSEEQ